MKKAIAMMTVLALLLSMGGCLAENLTDMLGGLTSIFSAEDDVMYGVGETAEVGSMTVKLTNVMESNGGSEYAPAEGNTFLVCEFEIENGSEKEVVVSTMMSFSASCDDVTYPVSYEALAVAMFSGKYQLDTAIEPGKKQSGVVGYEVPKEWKKLRIRYTTDLIGGESATFGVDR